MIIYPNSELTGNPQKHCSGAHSTIWLTLWVSSLPRHDHWFWCAFGSHWKAITIRFWGLALESKHLQKLFLAGSAPAHHCWRALCSYFEAWATAVALLSYLLSHFTLTALHPALTEVWVEEKTDTSCLRCLDKEKLQKSNKKGLKEIARGAGKRFLWLRTSLISLRAWVWTLGTHMTMQACDPMRAESGASSGLLRFSKRPCLRGRRWRVEGQDPRPSPLVSEVYVRVHTLVYMCTTHSQQKEEEEIWVWLHTSVISALKRLRQRDWCEF